MSLDTVNFRLTKDDTPDTDFMSETPCYLDNDSISEHRYSDGNTVVTGDVGGYKVIISPYQVRVKDCSLCKWHLGDNFKELTRGDTRRAIERLSDTLHLPIDKAAVTRLDFALNIIVKQPIDVYLHRLGELCHYQRQPLTTGLYYTQTTETYVFYDKVREQKKAGAVIPETYQNRNVLRIEQRYTNRVSERLKTAVKGETLYDETFYNMLLNRWRDTYNGIAKINDVTLNFSAMKTKNDLHRLGILALVKLSGGQMEVLTQIYDAQKRGELTRKQAYDLRAAINNAMKEKDGLTASSNVIAELDEKVKRAVKFYR